MYNINQINTINKLKTLHRSPRRDASVEVSWKSADRGWICAKRWRVVKQNKNTVLRMLLRTI